VHQELRQVHNQCRRKGTCCRWSPAVIPASILEINSSLRGNTGAFLLLILEGFGRYGRSGRYGGHKKRELPEEAPPCP
ncbi:MAG: hypothetical protein IJM52_04600, partial [Spirochaetales bacterium]|nr:hypothetical protein [Spirochaetales bacterium]